MLEKKKCPEWKGEKATKDPRCGVAQDFGVQDRVTKVWKPTKKYVGPSTTPQLSGTELHNGVIQGPSGGILRFTVSDSEKASSSECSSPHKPEKLY